MPRLLTPRNVVLIVAVAILGRIVLAPVINRIEGATSSATG